MDASLALLQTGSAAVLAVDFQEKLMPAIHEGTACLEAGRKLVEAAGVLEVPVLATEQYPAGLGRTCPQVWSGAGLVVEKMRFSSCVEGIMSRLHDLGRRQVVVAGVETHVCVQQTVLDLLRTGYVPYVCADAVGSRRALDRDVALDRMRQAGAVVTTVESVIFELLGEAGGERFKQILKIVK